MSDPDSDSDPAPSGWSRSDSIRTNLLALELLLLALMMGILSQVTQMSIAPAAMKLFQEMGAPLPALVELSLTFPVGCFVSIVGTLGAGAIAIVARTGRRGLVRGVAAGVWGLALLLMILWMVPLVVLPNEMARLAGPRLDSPPVVPGRTAALARETIARVRRELAERSGQHRLEDGSALPYVLLDGGVGPVLPYDEARRQHGCLLLPRHDPTVPNRFEPEIERFRNPLRRWPSASGHAPTLEEIGRDPHGERDGALYRETYDSFDPLLRHEIPTEAVVRVEGTALSWALRVWPERAPGPEDLPRRTPDEDLHFVEVLIFGDFDDAGVDAEKIPRANDALERFKATMRTR